MLSHGWPLSSDSWEALILFLASNGFRCVAHDRRGLGRSSQTWHGNEMNSYADDLAIVIEALDLRDVVLVGFSSAEAKVLPASHPPLRPRWLARRDRPGGEAQPLPLRQSGTLGAFASRERR